MEFTIYLDQYAELFNLPFGEAFYRIMFWYFGWMPFAIAFLWLAREMWLEHRGNLWGDKQKYVLLAIDVPANNEQSPKSVENLFSFLHAAQSAPNLVEKWWEGKSQQAFSFEIVSIEGYIQFLIYTPEPFREFVKTGIYAQYPDAEIAEVEDYVDAAPRRYPDMDKDIWGSEFILTGPQYLPIKLYKEFEHILGAPETTYRDTMANLMDVMSSMGPGEQLWFQIIASPANFDWIKDAAKAHDKLAGLKSKNPFEKTILGKALQGAGSIVESLNPWNIKKDKSTVKEKEVSWMNMHPGVKTKLEAIQMKANKIGYNCKIRAIYLADKTAMNKAKGVNGFVGYMKQFAAMNLNGFMPDGKKTATSTAYFQAAKRLNRRKNRIIRAYASRSGWLGRTPYILNVEELATIWHFPLDAVTKAPLLQRSASRKVEAPMSLPFGEAGTAMPLGELEPIFDQDYQVSDNSVEVQLGAEPKQAEAFIDFLNDEVSSKKPEAPSNLPFV